MIPYLPAFVKSKINTADLFLCTAVLITCSIIHMDTFFYFQIIMILDKKIKC